MAEPAAPEPGLLTALRRMSATLLEVLQVRLALIGNELEQEKLRLVHALTGVAVSLLLAAAGLVTLTMFIALLAGEEYRLWALGGLTLLYMGSGFALWRLSFERLKQTGGPFAASLEELTRDRSALQPVVPPVPPVAPPPPPRP